MLKEFVPRSMKSDSFSHRLIIFENHESGEEKTSVGKIALVLGCWDRRVWDVWRCRRGHERGGFAGRSLWENRYLRGWGGWGVSFWTLLIFRWLDWIPPLLRFICIVLVQMLNGSTEKRGKKGGGKEDGEWIDEMMIMIWLKIFQGKEREKFPM